MGSGGGAWGRGPPTGWARSDHPRREENSKGAAHAVGSGALHGLRGLASRHRGRPFGKQEHQEQQAMKTYPAAVAAGLLAVLGVWCAAAPVPPGPPQEVAALSGHEGDVVALAFSPDGKLLASAGEFDGTARVWAVEAGKCLHVLRGRARGRGGGAPRV